MASVCRRNARWRQIWAISVGTLRKALADLTAKGLLERRQGSGNYVRAGAAADSVYAFFRLELIEGGGLPTAEVLSVDAMDKPGDLPDFGQSGQAHRIRRLRRLNGIPAALEEIWLDASYVPDAEGGRSVGIAVSVLPATARRCGSRGPRTGSGSGRCPIGAPVC